MPDVVTHLYDPAVGVCPNICLLHDLEAHRILDRPRNEFRPTLKSNYLSRRRSTEQWLAEGARKVLGRSFDKGPSYFFLGDFSHTTDPSRPAALIIPLSTLPLNAITFTLGDSMSVVEQATPRIYSLGEIVELFTTGDAVVDFGLRNRGGFEDRFIEVQVWDHSSAFASAFRIGPR